jgi:hypothetical protein
MWEKQAVARWKSLPFVVTGREEVPTWIQGGELFLLIASRWNVTFVAKNNFNLLNHFNNITIYTVYNFNMSRESCQ